MDYSIDFFNNLIPELNEKLNLIEKELNVKLYIVNEKQANYENEFFTSKSR